MFDNIKHRFFYVYTSSIYVIPGAPCKAEDSPRTTFPERGSNDDVGGPTEVASLQEEHSSKPDQGARVGWGEHAHIAVMDTLKI